MVGRATDAVVPSRPASSAGAGKHDRQRRLAAVLERLERWGSGRDWIGTDPYDGVNATRLVGPLRTHMGRRLLTQVVKRSPVDLRPLLGVRPERNSATMAYVASAYALDGSLGSDANRAKLHRAIELLETMRLRGYREPCWGYHFHFRRACHAARATSPTRSRPSMPAWRSSTHTSARRRGGCWNLRARPERSSSAT